MACALENKLIHRRVGRKKEFLIRVALHKANAIIGLF
jgi:hypothetical protein